MKKIAILGFLFILIIGCEKGPDDRAHQCNAKYVSEYEYCKDFKFNDTINLGCCDCLNNLEDQSFIYFDSVINDSRCPNGAVCCWEGNAVVRLKIERYNEVPILFDLNTNGDYQTDTLISGYRLFLIGLNPYPEIFHKIKQEDYQVEIMITKE
jgi:hypothetical protein